MLAAEVGLPNEPHIQDLLDRMCEIVDTRYLPEWFKTPNHCFGDMTPAQAIQSDKAYLVWQAVERIENGEPT